MRSDTDDGPEGVACSLHTVRMIKKLTWVRRNGSECRAQNLKKVALSPVQTGFLDERIYTEKDIESNSIMGSIYHNQGPQLSQSIRLPYPMLRICQHMKQCVCVAHSISVGAATDWQSAAVHLFTSHPLSGTPI